MLEPSDRVRSVFCTLKAARSNSVTEIANFLRKELAVLQFDRDNSFIQ